MALVPCPECKHQISTLAAQCPSCGYVLPSIFRIIANPDSPEENRFKTEALQIVTVCEQALDATNPQLDSVLTEMEGMLERLKINFQTVLSTDRYRKLLGYLVCLVNSIKYIQSIDSPPSPQSEDFLVALIGKSNVKLELHQAMRIPKAFIHDLKIMLDAGYGNFGEVERMQRNLAEMDPLQRNLSNSSARRSAKKGNGCMVLLAGILAFGCCIAFGVALL